MKKEDLRPVKFRKYPPGYQNQEYVRGWFHMYITLKNDDGSEYLRAYVELEDGTMVQKIVEEMQFTDREVEIH